MKNGAKSHLALFAANLIYSANYSIAKEVMPSFIGPFGFILLRVLFGTLCFMTAIFPLRKTKVQREDRMLFFWCAVTGVAVNQLMFFKGLELTTPIHASLFMITCPIIVMVISMFIARGEKISLPKILGILLGAIGCVLLVIQGGKIKSSFNAPNIVLGDLFIFINASSYAVYLVLVKKLTAKYDALTISAWIFFIGMFMVLPFGAKELSQVDWSSFDTKAILDTLYVVIFATVFAYGLYIYALAKASPSTAGIYIYLQPLLASVFAILYGQDKIDALKIIAAILIGAGVYLVTIYHTQRMELKK